MKNGVATLQNSLAVPQKFTHRVTAWHRNSTSRYTLSTFENKCPYKTVHKCSIVVLFKIVKKKKKWKQPTCPSIDEWIFLNCGTSKQWNIYYSTINRNKVRIDVSIQINLEKIMISERSWTQKTTFCIIPFILNVQNKKIHKDRRYISGYQGLREEDVVEWWLLIGFLLRVIKILWS